MSNIVLRHRGESRGIDSYIGERPISIKTITYETKYMLIEMIEAEIIYYEKNRWYHI